MNATFYKNGLITASTGYFNGFYWTFLVTVTHRVNSYERYKRTASTFIFYFVIFQNPPQWPRAVQIFIRHFITTEQYTGLKSFLGQEAGKRQKH
uniref:Uncharacterized protein n=1 Tax=Glossina brevipalpis TaxID=37001 RepID=A0A1A9WBX8_9MUSC